jgi:hypothetical protein
MSNLFIEGAKADDFFEEFSMIKKGLRLLETTLTNQSKPTDYLTRHDVAEMFKVSLVTVSDWTAKGFLKSYKLANRVYYKRGEIEQALTEIHPKR